MIYTNLHHSIYFAHKRDNWEYYMYTYICIYIIKQKSNLLIEFYQGNKINKKYCNKRL
jgi:hypothetical protein